MDKKFIYLILLICIISTSLIAKKHKEMDDLFTEELKVEKNVTQTNSQDSLANDIIQERYKKKDARLAMFMSAVLPGAGQFYADPSAITTYIFPAIELAVIGGIIYYTGKGNEKVKEYKKYATGENVTIIINGTTYTGPRYWRDFQYAVEDTLCRVHSYDIYDGEFFRLDNSNTQHFYEDIGKYNKYIFGWADWYIRYAEAVTSNLLMGNLHPTPIFVWSGTTNDPSNIWIGNRPLNNPTGDYDPPSSDLRKTYIKMRQKAEDFYYAADYLSFLIAFNHIGAAIDAVRVTNARNRLSLTQTPYRVNYYTTIYNNHITPMLGINISF